MKAKIKATGEIVEVFKNKHGVYIDEEHRGFDAESLDFILDEEIHWQDVRERAAIAAMQGMLANPELIMSGMEICYRWSIELVAVNYADKLVERLKKK